MSQNRHAHGLRRAIDELPAATRRAMLEAIEHEDAVIVGAYADRRGGVCPLLAAHRRGARAAAGGFPRAWDEFARARRPRRATPRELEVLVALLQESVVPEQPPLPAPASPRRVPAGVAI